MGDLGGIKAAKLENSERLQMLLQFLKERNGTWATRRTIRRATRIEAVNTAVAELRANGIAVDCAKRDMGGTKRWAYRLTPATGGQS